MPIKGKPRYEKPLIEMKVGEEGWILDSDVFASMKCLSVSLTATMGSQYSTNAGFTVWVKRIGEGETVDDYIIDLEHPSCKIQNELYFEYKDFFEDEDNQSEISDIADAEKLEFEIPNDELMLHFFFEEPYEIKEILQMGIEASKPLVKMSNQELADSLTYAEKDENYDLAVRIRDEQARRAKKKDNSRKTNK